MKVKEDAIPESLDVTRTGAAEDALASLEASLDEALVPAAAPLPPPPAPSSIAAPPSSTASSFSKSIGTKTLFGVGIAGLSFSELGGSSAMSAAPSPAGGLSPAAPPASSVPDFLNEVTKALDAQASEARARALEASPAAAAATTTNGTPATMPGRQSDGQAQTLAPTAKISSWLEQEPEFEEPDDGPTSLTPGIISISDDVTAAPVHLGAGSTERRRSLEGGLHPSEQDEPVVLGLPPQSGVAAPRAIPTPFAWSTKIERSDGIQEPAVEAEAFQPTPPAGVSTGLPAHRRSGTPVSASALQVPSLTTSDAKRRTFLSSTENPAFHANGSAAYRDSVVQQHAAVTTPDVASSSLRNSARAPTGEVRLLKSYIKLGTTTLVALIAATFVGGLLVGFLVGRGRSDSSATGPSASLHPHGSGPGAPAPVHAPMVTAIPTVDITPIPVSDPSSTVGEGRSADARRPSTIARANKERQRGTERVTDGEKENEAKAKAKTKEKAKEKPKGTSTATASMGAESLLPAGTINPSRANSPRPRNTGGTPIVDPLPRPNAPAAAAGSTSRSMTPASAVAVSPKAPSSSASARPSAAPPKGSAGGVKPSSKNAASKSGWHDPFAD